MIETKNYKFSKPELTDTANIEVLAENWEKVDSLIGGIDQKIAKDVLTKTNTTAYTPTGDYHPATKKYVDENRGDKLISVGSAEQWAEMTAKPDWGGANIIRINSSFRASVASVTVPSNVTEIRGIASSPCTITTPLGTLNLTAMGHCKISNLHIGGVTNFTEVIDCIVDGSCSRCEYIRNSTYGSLSEYGSIGMVDKDVLSKTNTSIYLPTKDYHPATKKYVDDKVSSISPNNLSGTLPISKGGTGATSASAALSNLGVKIQTTVPSSLSNGQIVFVVEG